jgi:hypothetical protein
MTAALALVAFSPYVHGTEPTPLAKSDAIKILISLGYQGPQVGAIVQGLSAQAGPFSGGPNVATVIGIGRLDGKVVKIEATFLYDVEIGWFMYGFDDTAKGVSNIAKLELWSTKGHRTIALAGPAAVGKPTQ